MMDDLLDRIAINPEVMLGKPVIRGTRITVEIILEKIAAGCSVEEILDDYPHLSVEDVRAAFAYSRQSIQVAPRIASPTWSRALWRRWGSGSGGSHRWPEDSPEGA